jgi:signal transduction histidine kinase
MEPPAGKHAERKTEMGATQTTATDLAERRRVEAVAETLAAIHNHGESLGELAHDARNMVTALSLYCDLLEEPGVLVPSHRHYGSELRLLADACRRLVEKLSLLDSRQEEDSLPDLQFLQGRIFSDTPEPRYPQGMLNIDPVSVGLIDDLREELLASRDLLAALVGPSITVTVNARNGAWPVQMSSESLIRALLNLVKNSAESIRSAGLVALSLDERRNPEGRVRSLVLSLEDTGGGIGEDLLEKIFEPGFTTRAGERPEGGWASGHRGLGLSITRSIVEAAGGTIHAEANQPRGARFLIELPVRTK